MADQARIQYLFDKYLRKICTPTEVEELVDLLQDKESAELLTPRMYEMWDKLKHEDTGYPVDWQSMYDIIAKSRTRMTKYRIRRRMILYAAAVAAILILSGIWRFWYHHAQAPAVAVQQLAHDVLPGGNKAILTLANGKKIVLNQAANGRLAKQGYTQIIKLSSGQLAYHSANNNISVNEPVAYNTLSTPRGGQYQLLLPDGTKVWLNAASSIRYPTAFIGKERRVEVSGEAYFEVANDPSRPFIVEKNKVEIQVLGTHFNVNAYADEATIKVTLLEGSVRVSQRTTDHSQLLRIGQQAQLNKEGGITLIKNADIDEIMGWKNGLFVFHNDDLPSIMRRLERWYNVTVDYEGNKMISSHFTGAIRRQVNLSEVLRMLELAGGVHFEIEGHTIIVSA